MAPCLNQLLRAGEILGREVEFGLALRDDGLRRRLLALALRQRASRRVHGALRHAELGHGFPALGLERLDVHVGDDLTGGDEIAFVHQLVKDAAR